MDFSFSDTQTELRDLARKIIGDLSTNERLKNIEAEEPVFDPALWQELAQANLLGIAVPEAYGGSEFGFFDLCVLLQEIGRGVAAVPAYSTLVLGALPIARFGSDAQKQVLLSEVARGSIILTAGLVELDAADALTPTTTATQRDSEWVLNGVKSNVPAATLASHILVPATCDDGRVGLFLVEATTSGVAFAVESSSDRQPHAEVTLTDVRLGQSAVIGSLDAGAAQLEWLIEHATAALCCLQLGVSERALEMTAAYTTERRQFDRPIGSFQAVHTRAADAYINIEAMRLTAWEAAWRLANDLPASDEVAIAKYWAAEGGQSAAYACQHLHGGIGIDVDYPLHRYFIWSTQLEHSLGSASDQLARLGARIAHSGIPPSA